MADINVEALKKILTGKKNPFSDLFGAITGEQQFGANTGLGLYGYLLLFLFQNLANALSLPAIQSTSTNITPLVLNKAVSDTENAKKLKEAITSSSLLMGLSNPSLLVNLPAGTDLNSNTGIDTDYLNTALSNLSDEAGGLSEIEAKAEKQAKLAKGAGIAGAAGDLLNSFLPEKQEYSGEKGAITAGLDSAYDQLADAASKFGPVGSIVSGFMKANAGLGKVANLTGAGTDAMCVCAGTRVVTASGKFINIEDLCKDDGIVGWGNGLTRVLKVDVLIDPSLKQCVEIELESGLTLKCSFDHPVLWSKKGRARRACLPDKTRQRIRDWEFKPAIEIEPGDYLGVTNDIDIWGSKEMWEPYLVGLLIGDGYYGRSSIRLGTGDSETWAYIELHLLGKRTNYDDSEYNKEYREYIITNGRIHLEELGIYGQTKLEKRLPKNIHEYSKDSICKLIGGLFDSDGSVLCNKDGSDCKIVFYQSNIELIKQLRELLLKLGIHSYLLYHRAEENVIRGRKVYTKKSFSVCIRDKQSIIKFCEQIPLNIGYKKENLSRIQIFKSGGVVKGDRNRTGVRAYKIKRITPIGIQIVYNLLTSNDHTYLANGIITHNTTQDAILGSNFLPVIGWANGWGGRTTSTITKDNEAFAQVGSSYGGTENTVDEALEVSGKKYGLLSNSARRKAERQLAEARRLQSIIQGISDDAQIRSTLQGTMSDILSNRYGLLLQGGYDLRAIHVGKRGLKVSPYKARRLANNITFKLYPKGVEKEQQGTKIASHIEPIDLNLIITTFKEGGIIPSKVETIIEPVLIITEIAPLELELIESFLNGGEINIIPDGALHKNLHHMEDAEHLTKKGIPVVAIDNNELVAEIERGEIVLRLEVTEKLEELCKLYYSEDATKKEKDEYALEAGLMLVDEILNNTIDNTNKLL